MKRPLMALACVGSVWLALDVATTQAAPCLIVTLTGTHGGPQQPFNGLASTGTLVRYGDDANNCGTVKLQFDVRRGTMMRLQLAIRVEEADNPLGLLKRLDQPIQQDPIKAPVLPTNAALVVCSTLPRPKGISRAKPLAS